MSGSADLRDRFISGMSRVAATVNVVTTDGSAGRAGATVSAMSSVSADTHKPSLLVCLHHESGAAKATLENGVFCVNILRDDQSYISDTFAGRFSDQVPDKFDCAAWTTQKTGAPRVIDPLVAFDCVVKSSERVGTHHIFIGEVQDVFEAASGSPLIYAQRDYGRTTRIDPVGAPQASKDAALRIGCFHSFGPFVLPSLMARLSQNSDLNISITEGDHRRVLESLRAGHVDLALLYDFDLGDDIDKILLKSLAPYALLPADHPLAAQTTLRLAELAPYPMVMLDSPQSTKYFTSLFTKQNLAPNIAYQTASIEMLRGLVGHGLGYSLLATRPAGDQTYDAQPIAIRELSDPSEPSRLVLASRSGHTKTKAGDAFLSLCREIFAQEH